MGKPPFARDRQWIRRASKAYPAIDRRVWFDPESGYEYDKDPNPAKGTWHELDARRRVYREIDPETGAPIQGSEGEWRPLR